MTLEPWDPDPPDPTKPVQMSCPNGLRAVLVISPEGKVIDALFDQRDIERVDEDGEA